MNKDQTAIRPDQTDQKPPEHVSENRLYWDEMASDWVSAGERSWRQSAPTWGIWALPESQLRLLPENMKDTKTIELGCGTGYVSGWMIRRGAEAVGIDNSLAQLKTAERLMTQHAAKFELIHGNAEKVPYPDSSFDFAISEYGAAIWCDPYAWIPEAHRLLKPGGQLTFLGSHPLAIVSSPLNGAPCDERLHRPYFNIHKTDWRHVEVDPGGIEFNLTHSDWLRLFRDTGFKVINYLELQAPAGVSDIEFSTPRKWAEKWPSEQVWQLKSLKEP